MEFDNNQKISRGIATAYKKWRPQYHSPQTFVEFDFEVKTTFLTINGSRWKTIT